MATQIFQNSFLTRTEILKPIQKMAGEQLKWPAGSQFVVAGKFYQQTTDLTINLTSLTANTLYMVYAVLSGGVITGLTYSTNVNSVGPVGASGWKLIGAFYANGATSPVFGSLISVNGTPMSDWMNYTPSTLNSGNAVALGRYRRIGDGIELSINLSTGSTLPTGTIYLGLPSGLSFGLSKLPYSGAYNEPVGTASLIASPFVTHVGTVRITSATQFGISGDDGLNFWDASTPIVFTSGMGIEPRINAPISGWSNTPLVDL